MNTPLFIQGLIELAAGGALGGVCISMIGNLEWVGGVAQKLLGID